MLNKETNLTNSNLACNSVLAVYDKKITSYNRKLISPILLHACNNDFVVRNNNFRSYNGKLISFLLNLSHENQDKWIARIWANIMRSGILAKTTKRKSKHICLYRDFIALLLCNARYWVAFMIFWMLLRVTSVKQLWFTRI